MASTAAAIEITVVSAQGLRNASSFPFFWKRLKPYATVALSMTVPCCSPLLGSGIRMGMEDQRFPTYTTRTDDRGGTDPRWNEKFRIPVVSGFLADARSSVCVRVYARGGSQLGWCQVLVEDTVMSPPGTVSYLSYRLRDPRDGTRGHGIVNVAVKLDGLLENVGCSGLTSSDARRTAIGIPVSLYLCQQESLICCTELISLSTGKFDLQHHRCNAVR